MVPTFANDTRRRRIDRHFGRTLHVDASSGHRRFCSTLGPQQTPETDIVLKQQTNIMADVPLKTFVYGKIVLVRHELLEQKKNKLRGP
jgi:hypothetical protein